MGTENAAALPIAALPYLSRSIVHHVGDMNRAAKGQTHNRCSLEGQHLSVSQHPDAWRQIAKLGDAPAWSIGSRAGSDGMLFVDVLSMNPDHWGEVTRWAHAQGLVNATWVHRFFYRDDELGCDVYSTVDADDADALASAREEHEYRIEEEWEGARVEVGLGWRATEALVARVGFRPPVEQVKDMVLGCFVQDVLWPSNNTVGLWWNEKLDPFAYSAPRGCIHQTALDSGQLQIEIDPSACNKDDESAAEEDDLQELTRMAQR